MRKNHRKDVDKIIAFITKAAKGILKTDKFGKDMKYWYHDIKSAKRKPTKIAPRDLHKRTFGFKTTSRERPGPLKWHLLALKSAVNFRKPTVHLPKPISHL